MKADYSFDVKVDESGDEGFKFPREGEQGSSLFLNLAAAVFKRDNEPEQVKCVDDAKLKLGRPLHKPLHFRLLEHEQKLIYSRIVGRADFKVVYVSVYKPNLTEIATFSERSKLYNFASKLLLERVSWLCENRYADRERRPISGDGSASVVFSQRRTFCPVLFGDYLRKLQVVGKTSINWDVIDPDAISAVPHGDLKGLQVADVCASVLWAALVPHPVSGEAEHRYLNNLLSRLYSRDGRIESYGLKFYPSTGTELGSAIPDGLSGLLGLQAAGY